MEYLKTFGWMMLGWLGPALLLLVFVSWEYAATWLLFYWPLLLTGIFVWSAISIISWYSQPKEVRDEKLVKRFKKEAFDPDRY